MSSRILSLARRDNLRITTGDDWGEETITLSPTQGGVEYNVKGLATKHHNNVDTDGIPTKGKNAHITIIESDLTALNYPVRDVNGEVSMKNHIVKYADSTGNLKTYYIQESYPNETLGSITFILGDYNAG